MVHGNADRDKCLLQKFPLTQKFEKIVFRKTKVFAAAMGKKHHRKRVAQANSVAQTTKDFDRLTRALIPQDLLVSARRAPTEEPVRRFKVGDPVIMRDGGCKWRRGIVCQLNYRLENGTIERCYADTIGEVVPYQVQTSSKLCFALDDVDSEIVYDNAPTGVKYRFHVGDEVYCRTSLDKWERVRVIMCAYPMHHEYGWLQQSCLTLDQLPYAAYQTAYLDGSRRAGIIPYDNDSLVRAQKPNRTPATRPAFQTTGSHERVTTALQLWHAAKRWVISTHRRHWQEDRHNRMQTAMHRIEARKHEKVRSMCNQQKSAMQVMAKRFAHERDVNRVKVVNCVAEAPGVSALAKIKGEKMERLEKHQAALAERNKREAVAAAEQAAIADRMTKYLAIGDMINHDKDTRM